MKGSVRSRLVLILVGLQVVARARVTHAATDGTAAQRTQNRLASSRIRGQVASGQQNVAWSRWLQWASTPYQPYASIDPTTQVDPYAPPAAVDDDKPYAVFNSSRTGKGKGAYPVKPPIGKGKGWYPADPPLGKGAGVPPPGKGKGIYYPSKLSKASKVSMASPGKGKGSISPAQYDDYYNGKGSSVPPNDDALGKGSSATYVPVMPPFGQGKGGTFPVFPPIAGKGKGGVNLVPPSKSTGGKSTELPPSDDYYKMYCKRPWDGVSLIPDDMWLDQNHCLHPLPPLPPQPPAPPSSRPFTTPAPQSTRVPVQVTNAPVAKPTIPNSIPPSEQPSATLLTAIPTNQMNLPTSSPTGTAPPTTAALTTAAPTISSTSTSSNTVLPSASGATAIPSGTDVSTEAPTPLTTSATATVAPTPIGTTPKTEMPTKTNIDGIPVETGFDATYTLDPVGTPSADNFAAAADATLAYLKAYVEEFYSKSPFTVLVSFSGSSTENNGAGNPALISFDVAAIFSTDSVVVPKAEDLNILISTALSPPAVNGLLDQLAALGVDNPFSNTINVVSSSFASQSESNNASGVESRWGTNSVNKSRPSAWFPVSMVAVSTTLMILAGLLTIQRRRRLKVDEKDEEAVTYGTAATAESRVGEENVEGSFRSAATDSAHSDKESVSLLEEATQDLD